MTYPGLGGQQSPPQNASPAGQLVPGITPGVSKAIVIANTVIVTGPTGAIVGVFVYQAGTTPGPGNQPIASMTNQTADPYGNPTEPGVTAYVLFGGDQIALQLGLGNFAGTPFPGVFAHDQTNPANSDPMVGGSANPAGATAILWSGTATALSTGAGIQATDSTGDGAAGDVQIIGALCVVQGNLQVDGGLTVGGSSNTGDPATDATIVTTSGNFNGGTLTSHNHSYGHTHPF